MMKKLITTVLVKRLNIKTPWNNYVPNVITKCPLEIANLKIVVGSGGQQFVPDYQNILVPTYL